MFEFKKKSIRMCFSIIVLINRLINSILISLVEFSVISDYFLYKEKGIN